MSVVSTMPPSSGFSLKRDRSCQQPPARDLSKADIFRAGRLLHFAGSYVWRAWECSRRTRTGGNLGLAPLEMRASVSAFGGQQPFV